MAHSIVATVSHATQNPPAGNLESRLTKSGSSGSTQRSGHESVASGGYVMPDDTKKTGKPDRDRISAGESYEVSALAKKFDMPAELVKKIITQEGPMRKNVEAYLSKMKKK
jgi:hypothetical protein